MPMTFAFGMMADWEPRQKRFLQSIENGTAHERLCEKLVTGLVLANDNNRHIVASHGEIS